MLSRARVSAVEEEQRRVKFNGAVEPDHEGGDATTKRPEASSMPTATFTFMSVTLRP